MGFYNDVILPRLCDLVMRDRRYAPYRERVVATAEGRVLEGLRTVARQAEQNP